MSYWSPPKYDGQASVTSLNQLELSLSGFSDQEQLKKHIETIDDQKYFSPIIFELYNKILPLHEFIRFRSNKTEKDINSVFGVFTIILNSLFNSFNNWIDDTLTSPEARRYTINQSKESIILKLGEQINDKAYLHKITMNHLIVYIRNLLFTSIRDYDGESLYKIVDHYHGIADDIDKILFENENNVDSGQLKGINQQPDIQIVIDKLQLEQEDVEDSHQQPSTLHTSSSTSTISHTPPAVGSLCPDEENLVNIISSVTNRFEQIDNYLENPTPNPEAKTMLTLEQQKTVVSSCYNHLQTSIDIFSVADYPSKFKVDTVPVLRMMLSTLNTLEGYIDSGMSIVNMKPGEILEWTATFTKIATSLNNLILKNSSILSATQIVNYTNHGTPIQSNSGSYGNFPIRSSGKIKPPSSPFGSPAIMSFLMANNSDQSYSPTNEGSKLLSPLPPPRERCSQMIQLSQDSIMLSVMSAFALCIKDQMNGVLPQSLKNVSKFFNDNLAVFLTSIRTNIFCTYILLNPIYDMQSFT
ncbi:hypothetical protein PPL_01140 [Heterostelium album PN500]|uniref:Uncharacterized protein n=1 Tax=Heterostelium pallidum (strain ATCC 26659 / Pp 5 / PN500) TaxID=670386 RepID=D3AY81_HETP5|nr:hypothetical protein PPL_01140 [Heterostelium album PN500]EFA85908.1 hypothetical protein PPL_01140 [Heterostelium album PN500]|eukprot:XP_020438014.1 hypothetical protein PPL_01140 [Heterostelium album PN500]